MSKQFGKTVIHMGLKCILFQSITDQCVLCQRRQTVKILTNRAAQNFYSQSRQIRSLAKEMGTFTQKLRFPASYSARPGKAKNINFFSGSFSRRLKLRAKQSSLSISVGRSSRTTNPLLLCKQKNRTQWWKVRQFENQKMENFGESGLGIIVRRTCHRLVIWSLWKMHKAVFIFQ